MLLDQIWKQQLALVTYGNAFLAQNLSFNRWIKHAIFDQHQLQFRDLCSQKLLAQHFQIWLEGLKKEGVTKLSLHRSDLLLNEKNPNPHVELLAYAHFIVSHSAQQKCAWIMGKELATWDLNEQIFEIPEPQRCNLRQETFWRYELDKNLNKAIQPDLATAEWENIRTYVNQEIFHQPWAMGLSETEHSQQPYTGKIEQDTEAQALIPTDQQADYAHHTLHLFDELKISIQQKIQHPYQEDGEIMTPEQQQNLRLFQQKIEEFHSKFIVKVANHYQTAQLSPKVVERPSTPMQTSTQADVSSVPVKSHNFGAFKLIIFTVLLCAVAYYFGL